MRRWLNPTVKMALAQAAGLLLCFCVVACGGADKSTDSASRSSPKSAAAIATNKTSVGQYRKGDADVDDIEGEDNPKSDDDYPLTEYGHAAPVAEKRDIASLVKRYYSAAASEDGVAACRLLYSRLARHPGLKKTVPEDRYSRPVNFHVPPNESCAAVTSLLFELHHGSLVRDAPTLQVTGVRVDGAHGLALLGFKTAPEQWIPVAREGAVWKVHALIALLLP
jgi:hypothetical protein